MFFKNKYKSFKMKQSNLVIFIINIGYNNLVIILAAFVVFYN